jgi:hypothetical protein
MVVRLVEEQKDTSIDPNVRHVINVAKQELKELIKQRSHITRRIAVTKQTIVGLASVFGNVVLEQELLDLLGLPGVEGARRPGFTRSCRMVLIEAAGPVGARDVCERLSLKDPEVASRHKDLLASVTTILNRLVAYGEVRSFQLNGKRVWQWMTDEEGKPRDPVDPSTG